MGGPISGLITLGSCCTLTHSLKRLRFVSKEKKLYVLLGRASFFSQNTFKCHLVGWLPLTEIFFNKVKGYQLNKQLTESGSDSIGRRLVFESSVQNRGRIS